MITFAVPWILAVAAAGQPGLSSEVEARLWKLDAPRLIRVQRSAVNPDGAPTMLESARSLPSPVNPSVAHVLRADGSPVALGEGLRDVARSRAVDDAAGDLRSTWLQAALGRGVLSMAAAGVGTVGVVIGVGTALAMYATLGPAQINQAPQLSAAQWLGLGAGLITMAAFGGGGAVLAALGYWGGRQVILAAKTGLLSSPKRIQSGTDWPVGLAAEVVDEHNRRVLEAFRPGTPPPTTPGSPVDEPPPVIITQL